MGCLLLIRSGRRGMLIVETIGRIRREHFVKGKSIKEIARDLKISRNTVRKVLRSGETSFSYEREIQPRPKLGRWKTEIDRMLVRIPTKPAMHSNSKPAGDSDLKPATLGVDRMGRFDDVVSRFEGQGSG